MKALYRESKPTKDVAIAAASHPTRIACRPVHFVTSASVSLLPASECAVCFSRAIRRSKHVDEPYIS